MKKFMLIFIATYLFAFNSNSIIDTYRFQGIKPTINKIEKLIQSKTYWLDRLHNINVKYGYYEDTSFILLCNKTSRILKVLKYKNGKIYNLAEFNNLIVGKLGQKQKEGDLRTPIGVYSLKYKIIPKNPFYGPLAFVTSYPNLYDKLHHRDGHGIWIHGKPLDGKSRPDLSKGCIVLNNDDLQKLANIINYQETVLQIYQKPVYASKEDIASILALIYKWRWAWEKSNLKKYISYYANDFHRSNGEDLKQFINYKKRVFEIRKHQKVTIYFKDIKIVPYQNPKDEKIYRVTFYEEYIAPTYTFKGNKEIFVKKEKNKFKIFIEK